MPPPRVDYAAALRRFMPPCVAEALLMITFIDAPAFTPLPCYASAMPICHAALLIFVIMTPDACARRR